MEYFLYILCALVGWIIFYYTVKGAVKNGIVEARGITHSENGEPIKKEKPLTLMQKELQYQYDRGIITLEQYQKGWNKE